MYITGCSRTKMKDNIIFTVNSQKLDFWQRPEIWPEELLCSQIQIVYCLLSLNFTSIYKVYYLKSVHKYEQQTNNNDNC